MSSLQDQFGAIDIYLFDQLLRGRIRPGDKIVDCGCGGGRNLVYLMREGFDVYGLDPNPAAIDGLRAWAAHLAPQLPSDHFRTEPLERSSFRDGFATVAISSAVLHFAKDDAEFEAMLNGTWRLLAPGGLFFCRLASTIGIEEQVRQIEGRRHRLPDGSERYLVDEDLLLRKTAELGAELIDPIKTTVVSGQRSMTTWVIRKR